MPVILNKYSKDFVVVVVVVANITNLSLDVSLIAPYTTLILVCSKMFNHISSDFIHLLFSLLKVRILNRLHGLSRFREYDHVNILWLKCALH